MTIEIKLDTNALASLIESDPEFKTKIQQSVLANIANRYLKTTQTEISAAVEATATLARTEILNEYGTINNSGYGRVFSLKRDHQ